MRLLLVEDDRTLSRIVATLLKQNHYTVDPVYDGETALDVLSVPQNGTIYDGVILDLMIPKKSGLQVLRELRQKGNDIPVLILSAKSEIEDKVEGLDSGANDYLTKPFESRELLARLRALLRKNSAANDSVLRVGNVSLNTASCKLSTAAGSYELVGKEFQIMQLFMTNFERVLSAERIMERIWESDSDATVNTVWTYISYIRRKLESLNADIRIATRRNTGYVLCKGAK